MATTPRPPRSSNGPPQAALPALPMPKMRKSMGNLSARSNAPGSPRGGLRAPSNAHLPPPTAPPTTALPTPKTPNGKTIRKVVSINSFPQPPKGDSRISSLPPSPLAGGVTPARKSRNATAMPKMSQSAGGAPSMLNGGGDSRSILSSNNVRNSDGLVSVSSPPQSRSSSAQDSYSTSATTYDDPADVHSTPNDRRASKGGDSKGNVLVSVRVRPDSGASEHGRVEGEWMVDGRKSLVSYRGKEGGDYHYGKPEAARGPTEMSHILTRTCQTMCLQPTTTTTESTITLPSDSSEE